MDLEALKRVAGLIAQRNAIDADIAAIIGRPLVAGHLGEWIAAQVFDIELEASAAAKAIDGRFTAGPLIGCTVNVKHYGKRDVLDVVDDLGLEYYLVMTGPRGNGASSRGATRPILVETVYLFEAGPLLDALRTRGVKIGAATSVASSLWGAAEIFPAPTNAAFELSVQQREALSLFSEARS